MVRIKTAIALTLLLSLLIGCAAPPDSAGTAYIRIETDREKYEPGESIAVTLILVNNQSRDLQFNFTSGHQWDLTFYDSNGKEVFDAAKHLMYTQALSSIKIKASSEEKIGYFTWDQKDNDGGRVKSGRYTMKAKLVGYDVKGEKNITIESASNKYEAHEWGVFQQEYNSSTVDVLTEASPPVLVKKPVIYFHSPSDLKNVSINLMTPYGGFTELIPEARTLPSIVGQVIEWKFDIRNNRIVAANGSEYSYLFYEAEIKHRPALDASMNVSEGSVSFRVKNLANYTLSDLFLVYGTTEPMWKAKIFWVYLSDLKAGEEKIIIKNEASNNTDEAAKAVKEVLRAKGLTANESGEMLAQWEQAWFYPTNSGEYSGIVYFIPQEEYDRLFSLNISPAPEKVVRAGAFHITDVPVIR